MNSFNYEYPVRQHFGKGCAEGAIKEDHPWLLPTDVARRDI